MWCFIFYLCSINVSLGYCVPCAYPRICSNCAAACFHILGFIAREHRDRGDPVYCDMSEGASRPWRSSVLRYVRAYARGIIYWIATPSAMARNDKKSVCGWGRTRGQNGNAFLYSLTTPPLRGTPPTEGNLARCFIFLFVQFGILSFWGPRATG